MNNSWVNENTLSSNTLSSCSELKHLFLADSLQLTYLTSRLGGAESFATSFSFEKLDCSCSPSCPYFWRQFLAILAASQPCIVDIPLIRSNIKGGTKHFPHKIHRARAIKLFSRFFRHWSAIARLKSFIARARCILWGKMLRAALYIASYKRNIDKTRLPGCPDHRELTPKIWARRGTVEFLKWNGSCKAFCSSKPWSKIC